ncbi:uracil-DNA glycosylase family protein [Pseudidiomarina insulisalsae]|uniref:Uracil-DNA glycosylase n=1 Tax=Pseudidiomarina insulisalsae TaxID=575789 RepID=A0A432YDQ3_9GAMM|nr:uracil-DNA glycosylase family protein [Pseudidiomarina insulisalsae]RUO58996.1 uracil-DNA glycosylase [Pseudidiomarina insulisalsae]
MSLDNLLEHVRACRVCEENLPFGARPVLQASSQARILIAGQAPGRRVHATGLPFNDPSGDRLRQWLGVDRQQFYDARLFAIMPMGFCYPGTGKSGDLPPRPECAPLWRKRLMAELPALELVLPIGQYAINWHLAEQGMIAKKQTLTETVKQWQQFWPHVLPMPHPSPRNNLWLRRNPWFEEEIIPHLQQRVQSLINR